MTQHIDHIVNKIHAFTLNTSFDHFLSMRSEGYRGLGKT